MISNQAKFYIIFGIGIGLIISALFFLYQPIETENLSEQQIISQARELGMVSREEYNVLENKLLEEQELSNIQQQSQQNSKVIVTIPVGANSNNIGEILVEHGVIQQTSLFHKLVDLFQIEKMFIAETYELEENMDMGEMLLLLTGLR